MSSDRPTVRITDTNGIDRDLDLGGVLAAWLANVETALDLIEGPGSPAGAAGVLEMLAAGIAQVGDGIEAHGLLGDLSIVARPGRRVGDRRNEELDLVGTVRAGDDVYLAGSWRAIVSVVHHGDMIRLAPADAEATYLDPTDLIRIIRNPGATT